MIRRLTVATDAHTTFVDITRQVEEVVREADIDEAVVTCLVLHTTAGLTINENADPDVLTDLANRLERVAPWQVPGDRHREGNSAAHLKASLVGPSLALPVEKGRLLLGTWQGVYLCEFDGPRTRTVVVRVTP